MKVSIGRAAQLIALTLAAGLVPMLHGSPAIGKSAIIHQVAKDYNLKLIDLRLSQCDPTDLLGFPHVSNGRSSYLPMETFPIAGDEIPKGYSGWLLFLDEATSASPAVQASAYKLILDKMVGLHHLHEKVVIVAAGNLDTDGAIVTTMSTALQSRMVHFEVEANYKEWMGWANEQQFNYLVTSFLEFRPDSLYTFRADHTDKTYASPRTWEFANRLLNKCGVNADLFPLLVGTLGKGVASEFYAFCGLKDSLPTMNSIIQQPLLVGVPDKPSVQFALCGTLAAHATADNAEPIMQYVSRLPAEFQVVCLRSMIKRNKKLLAVPAVTDWVSRSSADMY